MAQVELSEEKCKFVDVERVLKICWAKQGCKCLLGRGVYGRVYKGKWKEKPDLDTRIDVAVKVPRISVHYENDVIKKTDHLNILKFYQEIDHGPFNLIVTELCDGTLHDLVVTKKDSIKLTSDQLRNVVLHQIVEGLEHLHNRKILHRNLKPRNILYRIEDPLVMKVAGFGCSRSVPEDKSHFTRSESGSGYSRHFRSFGTDGWLAPEVLNGETHLRPAIDIFPLGLIFAFTLCEGQHPYGGDTKTSNGRIKNNQPMLDVIQQQLKKLECYDLIHRMLHPNHEKRPTTAEVLENEHFFPRPIIIKRDQKIKK